MGIHLPISGWTPVFSPLLVPSWRLLPREANPFNFCACCQQDGWGGFRPSLLWRELPGASSWWAPLGPVEPARWPSGACFFVRSQAWLHCGLEGSLPAALCSRGACLGSEGERMGKKKASHFPPSSSWLGLLTREVFCIRNGAVGQQDCFFSIRRNEAIIPRLASS